MAQLAQRSYISAVVQEGEFLKIWVQKDIQILDKLEDALNKLLHTPNAVLTPQDPSELPIGLQCYALHTDCRPYRVQVKGTFSTITTVHSIDYGFDFCIDYRNVRVNRGDDPFRGVPASAEQYYLAGVLIRGTLSPEELNSIQQSVIKSPVYVAVVAQNRATGVQFASLHSEVGLNYVDAWKRIEKLVEVQIPIQDQRMTDLHRGPPEYFRPVAAPAQVAVPPMSLSPVVSPAVPVAIPSAVPPRHQSQGVPQVAAPSDPRFLVAPPPPKTLKVGAQSKVIVSDATNGPWSFSVQISEEFKILERLTEEIQRVDKVLIRAPFNIGRPCIVFHSSQKVYARAILVSEGDRTASVAFIDYGDSGTTSIREVFEIPQKFLKTQQLSQKFRMAGLPPMKPGTDEYQRVISIFRKIVAMEKHWYLQVTPTEEGCSQNGELFDAKGVSIKGLVNEEKKRLLKRSLAYTPEEFPEIAQTVPVYISHVNNCSSFFVQTKMREVDSNTVQEELQAVCDSSPYISEARVNMPCMAMFEDGVWYRARVLSIHQTKAKLLFVDYGNETEQNMDDLKELPVSLVHYPTMGLHCCLQKPLADEKELHNLVNNDGVEVVVVSVEADKIVVKVLHNGKDISAQKPVPPPQTYSAPVIAAPDDSWNDNTSLWPNEHQPTRREGSESSGENRRYTIRDRFAARDAERRRLPNSNGGTNIYGHQPDEYVARKFDGSENGSRSFKNRREEGGSRSFGQSDGFRSRQDNDSGVKKFGAEDRGGYKKYGGDENGGFKKFGGDDAGGFKKFGGDDGGGFKKFGGEDGGGFKKFGGDDGGGFKKFGGEDGGGFNKFGGEDNGGFRKRRDDDKFGGGDSGAKPDRPMRTPVRYDERAPAGSEWSDENIDPGTEWDAAVTYFITPENFYVQRTPNSDAFVAMVEGIQTDYSNKFGFKRTEPPQVADIVIAKFSEDRVLYRAQVTVADPLTVRFVDYGNVDFINDNRDVYPVMSKLLDISKQAVRCKLAGIKPAGGNWGANAGDFFDKEHLKCKFIAVEDGLFTVQLSCDGQDIAEQLKQAGLAVDSSAGDSNPTIAAVVNPAKAAAAEPDDTIPADPVVASLAKAAPAEPEPPKLAEIVPRNLVGDSALVLVSYIEGVHSFYVHTDQDSINLLEGIISEASASLERLSVEPSEGILCIAVIGADSWYRARIVEVHEDEKVAWVHFIDYGDSADVPLTELYEIHDKIKSLPPLAIECKLNGDVSQVPDAAQDKFKEQYEQKQVVIQCHSISDNELSVTVYDERGVKLNIEGWVDDAAGVSRIPQLVLPASEMTLNILELTGPNTCLVSLPDVSQPNMNSLYTDLDDSLQVEVGCRCAVKCADGTWRRTVRPADDECYLVDVGRTEKANEFRPLAPQFVTVPAAVREVTLTWPILGSHRVKITRNEETYQIEPLVKNGFVSHVESATEIYVQSESLILKIDEITELLAATEVADLCGAQIFAAKFLDDEQWYRAQAIDPSDPLNVRFIDFGNVARVTEVAPLSAELLKFPPLAVRVQHDAGFAETAFEELSTLLTSSEAHIQLVEVDGKVVDLLHEGKSVADKILKRRPLKAGDVVYLAHIETPNLFYVHRHQDTVELEQLTEKLKESIASAQPVEAVAGKLVAAKFVEDDDWYRARIDGDMIFFVDHGNKAELLEVRELTAELAEVIPLAVKASLIHPHGADWGQPAIDTFLELLDFRPLTVESAVWQNDAYVVVLTDDGKDITLQLPADTDATPSEAKDPTQLTSEPEADIDQAAETGTQIGPTSETGTKIEEATDSIIQINVTQDCVELEIVTTGEVLPSGSPEEEKTEVIEKAEYVENLPDKKNAEDGEKLPKEISCEENDFQPDVEEEVEIPSTRETSSELSEELQSKNDPRAAEEFSNGDHCSEVQSEAEDGVVQSTEIEKAEYVENLPDKKNVEDGDKLPKETSCEENDFQPDVEEEVEIPSTRQPSSELSEELQSKDDPRAAQELSNGDHCSEVQSESKDGVVQSAEVCNEDDLENTNDTYHSENLVSEGETNDLSEYAVDPDCNAPSDGDACDGKSTVDTTEKDSQGQDQLNSVHKRHDSCSVIVDKLTNSPAADQETSLVGSEGFIEEPAPEKSTIAAATSQTVVKNKKVERARAEEKIVPGAISRGINFSSK